VSARRRLERERRTIATMIALYCRHHHHRGRELCGRCAALDAYARRRLERCVFGTAKPTCANCTVHCYRRQEREAIREVMRWAGPRMLLRHPVLALAHLADGRRAAPARRRDTRGAPTP
jgi:Nitrous oxide-stimulated promoter